MSGYKHATVTISQEEYRRLHEADMKKRFTEFSRLKSQDTGQNEVVLNLISQLEERERQLQSALRSVGQASTSYDNTILQAILSQNSQHYENLVEGIRNSNLEFQSALTSVSEEFERMMQTERETFAQDLEALFGYQNAFQMNENMKSDAAQYWILTCFTLVDFLQSQFDHERWAPGRLNRILRNLNIAENNLANGFYESCLQVSQQMYLELSDLNLEMEKLSLQWQVLFENTYASVAEIVHQMVTNGKVKALGLNGEELPDYVELNFWTNGRHQQLLDHTRQLAANIIQDQNILTSGDLERVYNQILPVIRESFESIVYDARLNALNSQLRMNIAEKALQALENHGFYLEASGYADEDMRAQFNASLACPDGSEVSINVLPTERSAQELSNELVVITKHPYLKTDHEARMHWEELSQTLSNYNLRVSKPDVITVPESNEQELPGEKSLAVNRYKRIES